jgi:homoserine kinase
VAGAWAANLLLGQPFGKDELVDAVLEGEGVASGSLHGDNVLPALFGGLVLTSPTDPAHYRRVVLPRALPVALIMPRIEILTQEARSILPDAVPFRNAVHNAADLAFMLDAFREGDWATVGRHMMRDRLVEPVRATLVPCYEAVRRAALDAGAWGCALTGSGPAMFAVAETPARAEQVLAAMQDACRQAGVEAGGLVTEADAEGVRLA